MKRSLRFVICSKFVHKKDDLNGTLSRPYLNVFFVLFDRTQNFRIVCTFSRIKKQRVHIWQSNVINHYSYFYNKRLQVSLMNGTFIIFTD